MMAAHFDFAVIGGGVIGLSIARELAGGTATVALVEREHLGRATSWAGAGILPPSSPDYALHPIEKIAAESFQLHSRWARELLDETGIDSGFRRCGALFVARTSGEVAALSGQCSDWRASGVEVQLLSTADLLERIPALGETTQQIRMAVLVPEEVQIRNPDHTRALAASCLKRGVQIFEQVGNVRLTAPRDEEICIIPEKGQTVTASRICIAAGAWSERLLKQIDVSISTLPVRGQMLLYKLPQRAFSQVVYEGMRYIVPRDDGHVLVGSTLEQAGFDAVTTPDALESLRRFGESLFADLKADRFVKAWAGLRPATFDGFPYIGPAPGHSGIWAACGHFRSGLLLSTGTAVIMRQLMYGEPPLFNLNPFRLDRG